MAALLDVRHLTVEFPVQGDWRAAVRDVSFVLAPGESLGLVGESGSGKSVTSLAILRLLVPQARARGQILFDGRDLLQASDDEMRHLRGTRIAIIFQEPMTALNPVMRVGDQVAEAVMAHAATRSPAPTKAEAWALALDALHDVGIPDHTRRARDYPHQLSGGMRQRIMIAMAVVNRPQLLIADEPTTALDVTIQAQILELVAELRQKFRLALMFISHDLAVVSQVSDRVAVMYAGSVVELASAHQIFAAPVHPYTRGLLHAAPTLRTDRNRPLDTIEGNVPALAAVPPGCPFEPRCAWRVKECARVLPELVEVRPGHLARCPVVVGRELAKSP